MGSFKSKGQRAVTFLLAVLFLASTVGFTAAVIWQINKDQKTANQTNQNREAGDNLKGTKLANFTPVNKVEKLQIIDLTVGTGEEVKAGASLLAHYTGALAKDGTIFESSLDSGQPASLSLNGVIKGWADGVPGMKVGGKRRLIIPAALAYGEQSPSPDIPPNSDLVFDIEVLAADPAS